MPDVTVTIVLKGETGQVEVTGPLANRIFMLGLLEEAKDAVLKYKPPVGPKILVPGDGLPYGGTR